MLKQLLVGAVALILSTLPAYSAPPDLNEAPVGGLLARKEALPFSIREVKDGTLYFSGDGRELKTPFYDLEVLGQMAAEDDGVPPYYLLSASPCKDCGDRRLVYLVRADGQVQSRFVYPGSVRDRGTHQLLLESRGFFGKCLSSKGDVFVVFQKEKVDRRHGLRQSVLVAEIGKDQIYEKLVTSSHPRIRDVTARVKQKACQEIKGYSRVTIPFDFPTKEDPSKI